MKRLPNHKAKQLKLLGDLPKAYGGELLKTRKGRAQGRPLDTKNTMHLVLKSSQAKGSWSFYYKANPRRIRIIFDKFAKKYGIKLLSLANVGNHLHLQIKLSSRHTYKPFIRATTAAIAMAITGRSRWTVSPGKAGLVDEKKARTKFWDYRPFTRVVIGWSAMLSLKDYINVNKWEGLAGNKEMARLMYMTNRTPLNST